jgi:phosphatidyl-myo-inositol dimannoside synthase
MRRAEFNVMMLLTDGFGGFGGISQFNRDFLFALDCSDLATRTLVFPRLIKGPIVEKVPESVVYMRRASEGKCAFVRQVMRGLYLSSDIDLVICGHIHLLPLASFVAARKRARLALIIHGIEAWERPQVLIAKTVSRLDAVVTVSRLTAGRFHRWSGIATERVFVLGNCVDLDRFMPSPRDPALIARYGLEGCRVVMTLGRLSKSERYKGVDEVIDILPSIVKKMSNLRYLIVGDGDDRGRLEEKANSLGLKKHIIFTGGISEAEKVAHYNLADAFVMPSSGEGFGIVLLEAAACGVPVIGSSIDGSREALLGGALGELVDPRSPESLQQAILGVLQVQLVGRRPKGIEAFGVLDFQAKVNEWLKSQATQILSAA